MRCEIVPIFCTALQATHSDTEYANKHKGTFIYVLLWYKQHEEHDDIQHLQIIVQVYSIQD